MAGIQHEVISPPKTCIGLRACEVDEREQRPRIIQAQPALTLVDVKCPWKLASF
jgi:hypothetical protein